MKRPLCVAPFLGYMWKGNASIDNSYDGRFTPCCEITAYEENGIKYPQFQKIDSLSNINLLEHEYTIAMRKKLMAHEWPSGCLQCKYKEEHLNGKARQQYFSIADEVERLNPDLMYDAETGTNKGKIYWLDLRPSNLCNQACRMCVPHSSSLLAEERKNNNVNTDNIPGVGKVMSDEIYDKTRINVPLRDTQDLSEVVFLKLLGGEPLVIQESIDMLSHTNENSIINITTNASKVEDSICETIRNSKFKRIHIQASIEGIGDTYEYMRYPSKWSKVETNLHKLAELQTTSQSYVTLGSTITIQMYSAFNIPDMVEWCLKFFNYTDKTPYITSVEQPFMRISLLSDEDKQYIMNRLEDIKKAHNMSLSQEKLYIDSIRNLLYENVQGDREKLLRMFSRLTTYYDTLRNQNLASLDSRFAKYIIA